MKRILLMMVAMAGVVSIASTMHASILTFGPGPYGAPVAATAEGIYTYSTFSGSLFRDSFGNGDAFAIEGTSSAGGGVMSIVRNDIVGGLFTFDGADVLFQFGAIGAVTFEGFLLGVSQGIDSFATTPDSAWSSHVSAVLSGVSIDELRVSLDAGSTFAEGVDNVRLSERARTIPEPGTLMIWGVLGLAGLGLRRRHS